MSEIKVQRGGPEPPIMRPANAMRKYPLDTMQVGEWFFVAGKSSRSMSSYVARVAKLLGGHKFRVRQCYAQRDLLGEWVISDPADEAAVLGVRVKRIK